MIKYSSNAHFKNNNCYLKYFYSIALKQILRIKEIILTEQDTQKRYELGKKNNPTFIDLQVKLDALISNASSRPFSHSGIELL